MEERDIHKTMLEQYAKRLYTISGRMNLYIHLCRKEDIPNIKRLKSDIQMINKLVKNIEIEINQIR